MSLNSIQEKMLAGEVYSCLEPELDLIRQASKLTLRRFNQAETQEERQAILRELLGHLGQEAIIEPPFYCPYGHNIYIGDYSYLNVFCTILDGNEVHIGKHVMIGPAVQIYTAAHVLQAEPRIQGYEVARAITVEDNVWIGGGAILLPGVRVGRNAVVGAGSVVTRDVAENMVVAGNPARVIREIEQG